MECEGGDPWSVRVGSRGMRRWGPMGCQQSWYLFVAKAKVRMREDSNGAVRQRHARVRRRRRASCGRLEAEARVDGRGLAMMGGRGESYLRRACAVGPIGRDGEAFTCVVGSHGV